MLQYRLSTLFLIFFVVATTLALFGVGGIWIGGVLVLAAFCLNRSKRLTNGISLASLLIFVGIVCPGLLPALSSARDAARRTACVNNLKQIGFGLKNYHDSKKHFPSVYACDKAGNPLFNWVVPLLPLIEYDTIYDALNQDEPWDSLQNAKALSQLRVEEFVCPSVRRETGCFSNYVAIIGPGTIWRKQGTVKLSDLPDGGSHTVALVEMANCDVHWAKPFALTVEEVLENMKSGKGVRISTGHAHGVNVLFADGAVRYLPSKMPLSLWRRILDGELKNQDIESLIDDPNAPDMVDVFVGTPSPKPWTIILGVVIWLFSIALLFHRAIKSRKRPEIEAVIQPTAS